MKNKERLEKLSEKYADVHAECYDLANCNVHINNRNLVENAYKAGAECQAETMYSDEEVINILVYFSANIKNVWNITEWFEQFKKK